MNNSLDIFASNRPSLIAHCSRLPGLSDHDIVMVESSVTPKPRRPVSRRIFLWSRADTQGMERELAAYVTNVLHRPSDAENTIEDLWANFKDACTSAIERHVPSKQTSIRFSQPWCNREVKRRCRRKKRAHRKARRTNSLDDWQHYRQLQKEARTSCRTAYNNFVANMITEDPTNKKLYSFIKSKKSDGYGVSPLLENNILRSTPREKAEILNRQFCSVFTDEDLTNIPHMGPHLNQEAPTIMVSVPGVEKLLRNLNPHKATGPDQISSRFLNAMSAVLAPDIDNRAPRKLTTGSAAGDRTAPARPPTCAHGLARWH